MPSSEFRWCLVANQRHSPSLARRPSYWTSTGITRGLLTSLIVWWGLEWATCSEEKKQVEALQPSADKSIVQVPALSKSESLREEIWRLCSREQTNEASLVLRCNMNELTRDERWATVIKRQHVLSILQKEVKRKGHFLGYPIFHD